MQLALYEKYEVNKGRKYNNYAPKKGVTCPEVSTFQVPLRSLSTSTNSPKLILELYRYANLLEILYARAVGKISKSSTTNLEAIKAVDDQRSYANDIQRKYNALKQYIIKTYYNSSIALLDRKSTRLNSSHSGESRMPSSA